MRFALCALLALCAGCATPVYNRPGATMQDLNRDHSRCMAQSGYGGGTMSLVQAGTQRSMYDTCMAGEGWTRG